MSPQSNLKVRDALIRKLTPFMMRAAEVDRELAKELLASLSAEGRHALWMLKSKAMAMRQNKRVQR